MRIRQTVTYDLSASTSAVVPWTLTTEEGNSLVFVWVGHNDGGGTVNWTNTNTGWWPHISPGTWQTVTPSFTGVANAYLVDSNAASRSAETLTMDGAVSGKIVMMEVNADNVFDSGSGVSSSVLGSTFTTLGPWTEAINAWTGDDTSTSHPDSVPVLVLLLALGNTSTLNAATGITQSINNSFTQEQAWSFTQSVGHETSAAIYSKRISSGALTQDSAGATVTFNKSCLGGDFVGLALFCNQIDPTLDEVWELLQQDETDLADSQAILSDATPQAVSIS